MPSSTALPGSNPSWTTVSFTMSSTGSISKVTSERGSAASLAMCPSLNPASRPTASAHSGLKVCQV